MERGGQRGRRWRVIAELSGCCSRSLYIGEKM